MKHPWADIFGTLFIPGNLNYSRLFLQKIDLQSGVIQKQIFKGNGHGHSVICSKTGKGWLIPENGFSIIEFDLKTLQQTNIITSDGNLIGGHGDCSLDGNRLYFVDRGINDKTLESNLVVYDTNRRKVVHKYEDVGIFSHDVKITNGEQNAIVASYGRVTSFVGTIDWRNYSEKSRRLRIPSFTMIDLRRQTIKSKSTFNDSFMLAHVVLDEKEKFVFIQGSNFLPFSECTSQSIALITKQRKRPLTIEEKFLKGVFNPGVQLKIDLQNAKLVKSINHTFFRAQSILLSQKTGLIYETFGISNRVVLFDKETLDIKKQFDFSDLGFVDPRGLALSADERFLFVSGRSKNIYCLDLCSENKLGSHVMYSMNMQNSHITFFEK